MFNYKDINDIIIVDISSRGDNLLIQDIFKDNIVIIAICIALLILLIIGLFFVKKSKSKNDKEVYKVDAAFIDRVLKSLGTINNIKKISIDNRRLAFDLINTTSADFTDLKVLSKTGVFVTKNTVKVLFKYDSDKIKMEIEKRGKTNDRKKV